MKRVLLSILIAVALALSVTAQIQTCTVSGTVYLSNGQAFIGAKIRVHRVRAGSLNGPLLSTVPQTYQTDSQGAFSFLLPRDSYAWIEAPIDGLFVAGGVPLYIPNVASAELRTLPTNVKLPQQVPVVVPSVPSVHATTHQHGGVDEVAVASPGANAIPKANSSSKLDDGWLSANVSLLGPSIDLSGAEAVGTLASARFPALTGDVTNSAGSLVTSISPSITPNWSGQHIHTLANVAAWVIGPSGAMNPVVQIDTSIASAQTGLKLTGRALGGGFDMRVLSPGSNEALGLESKGNEPVRIINTTGVRFAAHATSPATPPAGTAALYVKTDNRFYSKDPAGVESGPFGGGGTPGGSPTQLQYNNSGVFGGTSGATTDGTTVTLNGFVVGAGALVHTQSAVKTANFNVAANESLIPLNSAGGAFTATLEDLGTANAGRKVILFDATLNATANNITISRGGSDIFLGGNTSLIIDINGGVAELLWTGSSATCCWKRLR